MEKSFPKGHSGDRDWLWALALMGMVLLAYTPVWWAGYIWDDDHDLTSNPCIVGPLGLKEIWTSTASSFYPLVLTTFWVEYKLWGLSSLPYHIVNVVLHGINTILLWRVLSSLRVPGAFLGAALWALHPVEVQSVAWIAEMKNTESGLFYLLAIFFFIKWLRSGVLDGSKGEGWTYCITLLAAACAMLSKSSTVILPLVLCLCAWWCEGRWRWQNLVRVGPIFLMATAAAVFTLLYVSTQGNFSDPQWYRSWPERLAEAGDAIWFYLGKLVFPYPLVMVYPRWQVDAGQWISWVPLLAAIVVLWILWSNRETWSRPWFFTLVYFLIALLPVLGLIDHTILRHSLVFDHFQYLASMGPLALVGAGLSRFKPILAAVLLFILGLLSWRQARVYESQETLWADTLTWNPNCWVAYYNLGLVRLGRGESNEAMALFEKTVEINPSHAQAHYSIGSLFLQKGQPDEAIAQYQQVLKLHLHDAKVYDSLGTAFAQKGRMSDAADQYQKALQINPYLTDVHNKLGIMLAQNGHLDEAIVHFQEALKIDPKYSQAYDNLGNAYFLKGQVADAIIQFQTALRLDPGNVAAQKNLANAQARTGKKSQP